MNLSSILKNSFLPTYSNSYQPYLLKKTALVVFCLILLGVNLLGSVVNSTVAASSVSSSALVSLLNESRVTEGLNELNVDPKLVSAAYAKAEDIFTKQYWSHYGPNGETPWQFILGSGYDYVYAGENLAKGFNSAEGVHSAWMASKTHRENILNENYRDVGIAVVPGELNGSSCILVVQMFGSLVRETPSDDSVEGSVSDASSENVLSEIQLDITYPESGDIISDNSFKLSGTASDSISTIQVYDNSVLLGSSICESGIWDYRPDSEWSDGEHIVDVRDVSGAVADSVSFQIDTQPPVIDSSSVSVTLEGGNLNSSLFVKVKVDGEPQDVSVIIGDKSQILEKDEEFYTGEINISWINGEVHSQVIASDDAGNYVVEDISSSVNSVIGEVNDSFWGGIIFSSFDNFNRIFTIFLGILLLINSVALIRMNVFNNKAKTIFPMALWVIIAGVIFFISSRGTIY